MSTEEAIALGITFTIATLAVLVANLAEKQAHAPERRYGLDSRELLTWWVLATNIILMGSGVIILGAAYLSPDSFTEVDKSEAWGVFLISEVIGGVATALLSPGIRSRIAVFFPHPSGEELLEEPSLAWTLRPKMESTPLFPQMLNYYTQDMFTTTISPGVPVQNHTVPGRRRRGFDPHSYVHMVAMVGCLYFLGLQTISFISAGGLTGLAESYAGGISAGELLLNAFPFIVLALLGVGWGTRRNWTQVRQRLGLYWPEPKGALIALATVLILFMYVAALSTIWMALVSKETYEEQTKASEALAESVNSVGLAFLLAATAAIGEEIAYRGALQPVFGLWPTAIVFTLTHAQYTLTPAWLIILGVSLAFGWLRDHYGTGTSIIAHFLYNFVPLALSLAAPQEEVLRLFWTLLR